MSFWRKLEVLACTALLTCMLFITVRPAIQAAISDAFESALEYDVQAFLDGRVSTYRGYDCAVARQY